MLYRPVRHAGHQFADSSVTRIDTPPVPTGSRSFWRSAREHKALLSFLLGLSIAVALSNALLRGDINDSTKQNDTSSSADVVTTGQSLACSPVGTIFQDIKQPAVAIKLFERRVSEVVDERWKLLTEPSLWTCSSDSGIPKAQMTKLLALAQDMPGWQYDKPDTIFGTSQAVRTTKPVTFENFSSILMEFEREYECTLTNFQAKSVETVMSNYDIEGPDLTNPTDVLFCCSANSGGCQDAYTATSCDQGSYRGPDPMCGGKCQPDLVSANLSYRLANHHRRMLEERTRARVAVERTINTLRSFEANLPLTLDVHCMQRAALDMKNELALMADAASCLPKIWDAATSLHDRSYTPLPR